MRFSDLEGRRVGVWGLGREGRAVVRAVAERLPGTPLTLVDEGGAGGEGVLDDPAALLGCDVVVRSPGISRYRPEVARLAAAGVTLTTGTNLWFGEHPDARAIGVTGTKGKSTTSALIAHLAAAAGLRVRLGGNIGVPLVELAGEDEADVDLWVLELSSFQTSDLDASPPVGVLLNLHREHTDWHGTPERYREDKLALFAHRPGMTSVANAADPGVRAVAARLPNPRWFRSPEGFDAGPEGVTRAGRPLAPRAGIALMGEHNLDNVCAALAALEAAGVPTDGLAGALATFRPLAHRLEPVAERGGVLWVDDSIATIPEATVAAARALAPRPVVLLVGGRDRGQDYAPLAAYAAAGDAVAGIVGLPGNGARALERVAAEPPAGRGGPVPVAMADDLADAVARAAAMAPAGGAVLLSPGAPTGDDFRDFAARGDAFAALVRGDPAG
ncbi:UDP-N-acetylmuramoyl-L-alanine--D-glutamate ligase [Miltoncostaea marina]|uniref:UDP-N-acetylmuramoyl-L-alanine--D-glutamate ligase n=1 Tax=Miltoncostaea marina TaxID=2843215 RepID=UPI001C3E5BB4|nr:UDP-N-acetylmuramoyl-L-alanine--D-glutamate ligase [Miltoncostaea marina]